MGTEVRGMEGKISGSTGRIQKADAGKFLLFC